MEQQSFEIQSTPSRVLSTRTVWVHPRDADAVNKRVFPLPLPGTDRITSESPISMILAGLVDEAQMQKAFEDTLTYYPHSSGRLRRNGDDWSLVPGKRGVPLTFQTLEGTLDHHQNVSALSPLVVDSICTDITGASEPGWDEPMIRAKVTFLPATNETFVGWSSNHMVGDGEFIYMFLFAWSQYYQGLKPLFGRPTYEKYINSPPDEINDNPDTAAFISRYLPHLKELHPIKKWTAMMWESFSASKSVDLLFTADQIQQLRLIADAWPGRGKGRTSPHNALTGYIVSTMNRCLESPITRVSSIFSYRGIKNPDNLKPDDWRIPGPFSMGNTISHAVTPTLSLDEASSIGAVAAAIVKSVAEARDYERIKRIVAVSNPIGVQGTRERSEPKFWDDNTLVINTMGRADMSLQHFGFGPERVRAHAYKDFPGFVKCFPATASKQVDGSWRDHKGDLWVFMRVPTEIHETFMALIAEDLNAYQFPHNIVKREREAQAKILRVPAKL